MEKACDVKVRKTVMFRSSVRDLLNRLSPSLMGAKRAHYSRQQAKRKFRRRQSQSACLLYGSEQDIRVLSGPFRGMRYFNEVVWGPIEPKWIGSYELELHPIIYRIIETGYNTIMNVGSAEGYYSIGLAKKVPQARVLSYEVDPWSRGQQRRLAALNQVTNLQIGGLCTHKQLDLNSHGRTLVLCDIEGSEAELLNPQMAASLRNVDCLVELHDTKGLSIQQIEDLILNQFNSSHRIDRIEMSDRSRSTFSVLGLKTTDLDPSLLDEYRWNQQVWLWMVSGEKPRLRVPGSGEAKLGV